MGTLNSSRARKLHWKEGKQQWETWKSRQNSCRAFYRMRRLKLKSVNKRRPAAVRHNFFPAVVSFLELKNVGWGHRKLRLRENHVYFGSLKCPLLDRWLLSWRNMLQALHFIVVLLRLKIGVTICNACYPWWASLSELDMLRWAVSSFVIFCVVTEL